ncbi:hypothetical protein Tco_0758891 [Tanacetum coccineum]
MIDFLTNISVDVKNQTLDEASDMVTAPKTQLKCDSYTMLFSNIKLPILKKEEYDIWAMEMEHYLKYIDNEVWKVIQNGNSKKRISIGKDGVVRVLSPVMLAENSSLMDAKEIGKPSELVFGFVMQIQRRCRRLFSNNLKAFKISNSEGLETRIMDGFNSYFLNWKLMVLHVVNKKMRIISFLVIYSLFAKQTEDLDLLHENLEQIDAIDIEEMDINWQIAMIAIRMKKFYKKT